MSVSVSAIYPQLRDGFEAYTRVGSSRVQGTLLYIERSRSLNILSKRLAASVKVKEDAPQKVLVEGLARS